MKLLTHEAWKFQPDLCNYDVEFTNLALFEEWSERRIFHMGPGLHHTVGINLSSTNNIFSITCSPEEVDTYMEWAINNPEHSDRYQVMFGDIHKINPAFLPVFDVLSLPHFLETPDETRKLYGAYDGETLLEILYFKLKYKGFLYGYRNSSAWDRAEFLFKNLFGQPVMVSEQIIGWQKR